MSSGRVWIAFSKCSFRFVVSSRKLGLEWNVYVFHRKEDRSSDSIQMSNICLKFLFNVFCNSFLFLKGGGKFSCTLYNSTLMNIERNIFNTYSFISSPRIKRVLSKTRSAQTMHTFSVAPPAGSITSTCSGFVLYSLR